jgi:hypothetical protein
VRIEIRSIPHSQQRYETVGDWLVDEKTGDITIFVSDTGNDDYNTLVALHELIEVKLCLKRGITQKVVDDFDMDFEKNRPEGDESEPGDSPDAPYKREHFVAENIERQLAAELDVDWALYEKCIQSQYAETGKSV